MNLLCLTPTYGRTPELLNNCLACFAHQQLPEGVRAILVILDDLGNLKTCKPQFEMEDRSVVLFSRKNRYPSLAEKYKALTDLTMEGIRFGGLGELPDAFVIWDDDDIYLPDHLKAHAESFQNGCDFSYPMTVRSTYTKEVVVEQSGGRFWGSLAVARRYFDRLGGWVMTKTPDLDLRFLNQCLRRGGVRGLPDQNYGPQYIFRWGDTENRHAQHFQTTPNDTTWYDKLTPSYTEPVSSIKPEYDKTTASRLVSCGYSPASF